MSDFREKRAGLLSIARMFRCDQCGSTMVVTTSGYRTCPDGCTKLWPCTVTMSTWRKAMKAMDKFDELPVVSYDTKSDEFVDDSGNRFRVRKYSNRPVRTDLFKLPKRGILARNISGQVLPLVEAGTRNGN